MWFYCRQYRTSVPSRSVQARTDRFYLQNRARASLINARTWILLWLYEIGCAALWATFEVRKGTSDQLGFDLVASKIGRFRIGSRRDGYMLMSQYILICTGAWIVELKKVSHQSGSLTWIGNRSSIRVKSHSKGLTTWLQISLRCGSLFSDFF